MLTLCVAPASLCVGDTVKHLPTTHTSVRLSVHCAKSSQLTSIVGVPTDQVRFGRPNSRGDSKARHAGRLEKERRKTSRTTTFDLPDEDEGGEEGGEAAEAAVVEADA